MAKSIECPMCEGEKKINGKVCPRCKGKGYITDWERNDPETGEPVPVGYSWTPQGAVKNESIESTLNGLDNLIEADADVKKKEYDWTVDPDLFDEEEESGTSKGAKKGWSTRNKYQKRRDKWDNDPDYAEKMMRTGYYDKDESIKETLESLDNLIESAAWIKGTIGSNSLHKRDEETWQDVQKMAKRDGVTVTRADFDEYFNETAYETHYKYQRRHYIEIGNRLKNLPKDEKQKEFNKWNEIFRADNERYDSQRFADHIGLFEVDSVTETLNGLDNLIEKGEHPHDSDYKDTGDTEQEILDWIDKEKESEVLQSASGSLSPQKRNKAIRALQSIPRDQTLGKSDVIPNVDTALEQLDNLIELLGKPNKKNVKKVIKKLSKVDGNLDLYENPDVGMNEIADARDDINTALEGLDNLIEAKELKQQIGEALVQIKEALRPMPDAGRSGYNKFGHQGFRKEWSETIKMYEDFLLKCQQKTGMGATIGTRPARLNNEREFKERLRFLEIELRKCQQRM